MFRRFLAFILGMIFGMVLLLGGVVVGVYVAVTTVTPSDITPETEIYMGDLSHMSLADIATNLQNLYQQKLGLVDENGHYYTLGEFCQQYNINPTTAFGVELPQEVLDVPMFEYFNSTTDENGLNGVQRALKQVKVSAVPSVVNMFTAADENGNPTVKQNVIDELANYNLSELLDQSKGIAYVFQNIILADLVPSAFPAEGSDNTIMWALGQSKLGKILSAFSSSDSIYLQFGTDGAFETLGSLKVTMLLGGGDELLQSVLGDTLLCQLIDENGSVAFGGLLNSLYLGNFLSYKRLEVTNVEGYTALTDDNSVLTNGTQIIRTDSNGKYWVATLQCDKEHAHTADCYKFNWFTNAECTTPVEGLYASLVNITVAELTSGSTDSILNELKNLKIKDVLNGEISGLLANFADMTIGELMDGGIDSIYIGSVLNFQRVNAEAPAESTQFKDNNDKVIGYISAVENSYVMSDNGTDWYNAKLTCTTEHTHSRSCYSYIWMNGDKEADGIMAKFADKKISEISNLDSTIQQLTLRDVLDDSQLQSGILAELADVPIGNMTTRINGLYIGSIIGYTRKAVTDLNGYITVVDGVLSNDGLFAKLDGESYYLAELTCTDTDNAHSHTADCYKFNWFTDEECTAPVEGLYASLVNITVAELTSGSADSILNELKNLKIKDIINGEITGIMANFADMTIGELMDGGIDSIYLGSVLDFQRVNAEAPAEHTQLLDSNGKIIGYVSAVGNSYVMSDNGTDWYNAKLTCTTAHTHSRSCYSYIWMNGDKEADGIMAKFADKKISEISDLDSTIQQLTLRDVLDDSQLQSGILAELADVAIGDISTKIDSLYLGSVIGGIRNNVADTNGYAAVVDGVLSKNGLFAKLDGESYYLAELTCANSDSAHNHTADCYEFVWYSSDVLDGNHAHSDDELVSTDGHHARLTGTNKVLSNLKLGDIMSGSTDIIFNKVKQLTIGELAGNDISGIMTSLKDMTIDELMNGGVETVYLGTFLNYDRIAVSGSATNVAPLYKNETVVAYVGEIDGTVVMSESNKADSWYKARLICKEDHNHTERKCYSYIWMNGDSEADGLMSKFADKKVGEMQDINDSISSLTVAEVLGSDLTGVLGVVKDIPLKDLGNEFDKIYIGSMLNYYRKAVTSLTGFETVDGTENVKTNGTIIIRTENSQDWYIVELDCRTNHSHTDNCYAYIWYTDENCTTPVSNMQKALVNCTLSNINEKMDNLTLGQLGIGGNNILDSLQDVPITEISDKINDMKLGVVFGFVLDGEIWYQPCGENCGHGSSEHITLADHDGYYTRAKGLNGKMADKTITDLSTGNGLTDIVTELTIGELIDSGMMSLGETPSDIEENEYKFAIIFCSCENCGSITETIQFVGTKTYGCNLPDFMIYKSSHSGVTAKSYYTNDAFTHQDSCENSWKNLKLSEFVSALLSAIS